MQLPENTHFLSLHHQQGYYLHIILLDNCVLNRVQLQQQPYKVTNSAKRQNTCLATERPGLNFRQFPTQLVVVFN